MLAGGWAVTIAWVVFANMWINAEATFVPTSVDQERFGVLPAERTIELKDTSEIYGANPYNGTRPIMGFVPGDNNFTFTLDILDGLIADLNETADFPRLNVINQDRFFVNPDRVLTICAGQTVRIDNFVTNYRPAHHYVVPDMNDFERTFVMEDITSSLLKEYVFFLFRTFTFDNDPTPVFLPGGNIIFVNDTFTVRDGRNSLTCDTGTNDETTIQPPSIDDGLLDPETCIRTFNQEAFINVVALGDTDEGKDVVFDEAWIYVRPDCQSCDFRETAVPIATFDQCGICGGDGMRCNGCNPANCTAFPLGCEATMEAEAEFQLDFCGQCLKVTDPRRDDCVDLCGVPFGNNTACDTTNCENPSEPRFPPVLVDDCGVCGGDNRNCNPGPVGEIAPSTWFFDFTLGNADTSDWPGDPSMPTICFNDTIRISSLDMIAGESHDVEILYVLDDVPTPDGWPTVYRERNLASGVTLDISTDLIVSGLQQASMMYDPVGLYFYRCLAHSDGSIFSEESGFFNLADFADCYACDCPLGAPVGTLTDGLECIKGSGAVIDDCGLCRRPYETDTQPTPFNACVGGCDNMPFSTLELDGCGCCGGDGTLFPPAPLCPMAAGPGGPCTECPMPLEPGPGGDTEVTMGAIDECGECRVYNDPDRDTACADLCGVPNGMNNTCTLCFNDQGQIDLEACQPQELLVLVFSTTIDQSGLEPVNTVCYGDTVVFRAVGAEAKVVSGLRDAFDAGQLFESPTLMPGDEFFFVADVGPMAAFPDTMTRTVIYHNELGSRFLPGTTAAFVVRDCTGCDFCTEDMMTTFLCPRSRTETDQCMQCLLPEDEDFDNCLDCDGTPFGTKVVDSCGLCLEPTDMMFDDCDCEGTQGGPYVPDLCGGCFLPGDPRSNACVGCDNVVNSTAIIDRCGICTTPSSPNFEACLGCDGIPNSGRVVDNCGVCGGGGESCTGFAGYLWPMVAALITLVATIGVAICGYLFFVGRPKRRRRRRNGKYD